MINVSTYGLLLYVFLEDELSLVQAAKLVDLVLVLSSNFYFISSFFVRLGELVRRLVG